MPDENINLRDAIFKLLECEDLTIKQNKSLPQLSRTLSSDDTFYNEKTIACLTLKQVEEILELYEKFFESKFR